MAMLSSQEVIAAIVAGIISHIFFCHHEPSIKLVILLYLCSFLILAYTFAYVVDFRCFSVALMQSVLLMLVYSSSLLLSITVYRLFLHRCRHFPGPTLDILSKWSVVPVQAQGKLYKRRLEQIKRYGDVIRTGPRELLINDPTALDDVFGVRPYLGKGSRALAANGGPGTRAMLQENEKSVHKKRRQLWDKSFATQSLRSYQKPMFMKTLEVMEKFEKMDAQVKANGIAIDHWMEYFTFDLIGQLGFMRDFHMIEQEKLTTEVQLVYDYLWGLSVFVHVPYIAVFIRWLGLPSPMTPLFKWCAMAMHERLKLFQGEKTKDSLISADFNDVFGYFLQSNQESSAYKHTTKELIAESMVLVIGGSETTSTALSMLIFELTKQPEWIDKIRSELISVFAGEDLSEYADFDKLAKECPILNACISEALRVWPPSISGGTRETPKDAPLTVRMRGNRTIVIPKNTSVAIPILALHRDPRNFSPHPDRFRPERWLEPDKEEAFNAKAFIPFAYGPRSCVGKQFAYEELRTFVSQFVMRFDVHFAPEFDEQAFLDGITETSMQSRTKPLLVRLTSRT